MSRILVTGGSGFIGTNLINEFIEGNNIICNIDIHAPKIKGHGIYWNKIDIRDEQLLRNTIKDFDPEYVVDLAARTDLDGKSIKDYDTNTEGKKNVINACKDIKLKKYIMASSMLVCKAGYIPKNQRDYCPSTYYGKSKELAEKYLWNAGLNTDWSIIRPTSIWGPWFSMPYKDFFDMVRKGRYFHIGNRSCRKTYGYIKNSAYQIKKILEKETKNSIDKVFYIGDYEPYSIEDWANEIAKSCGRKIIKVPFFSIKIAAMVGDILKKSGIGFPMTSFRLNNMTTDNIIDLTNTRELAPNLPYTRQKGIKETLKWIRENDK